MGTNVSKSGTGVLDPCQYLRLLEFARRQEAVDDAIYLISNLAQLSDGS